MTSQEVLKLQERKATLEEELSRTERQIYELEGEYLQVRGGREFACSLSSPTCVIALAGDSQGWKHPSWVGRLFGEASEQRCDSPHQPLPRG